ncbi:DUF4367 domain-containing protein [Clostridioides difficile]|uniref:DUF4367 domain-containing protein n=1 Tax=Clostridioides difficile TaxID=1496 RepID=UPI0009800121|nr:DUF4367 domain-containing protein [Clostridioides difficile]EGT4599058.1 DUF4367 domain-containing protein [Clostridioides difficile]EKJ1398023.1 DUF4367 domain-containing protein [Clostridioides difficile]MBY2232116.1 DUF4367 domain-containing protein [Clostridioides difficile]MCR1465539.1 DUF4367 domain-containing protein [Clostridioides difficile]MCV2270657.1 DUF4367 domain-containing protein [Clostridioides difficile]
MDKNKLDIEKLLYEQLPKIEEKMLDRLPGNDEIDYKFSQEFESKMNVLIKNIEKSKKKNFYKYLKRIIIVCIVLLAGIFTITTIKTEAFPENLMRIMKKIYKEFTDYNFINPNQDKETFSFTYKEPEYIPSAYKEVERVKENDYLFISYKDNSDNYIIYQTMPIDRSTISLDTEDVIVENIKFDNHYAQYVEKENTQQLLWNDKNNIYMLSKEVSTKQIKKKDKKEFIKIAENIK